MSADNKKETSKPQRESTPKKADSKPGTIETKPKPGTIETKPKPEGPPNVTVRTYADVIINKIRTNKENK